MGRIWCEVFGILGGNVDIPWDILVSCVRRVRAGDINVGVVVITETMIIDDIFGRQCVR